MVARTGGADGRDEAEIEQAYRTVADALEQAVRETLAAHDPEPARDAVRRLTAIDDEYSADAAPPGWSLAFLVLADWFDVARTVLADEPDRAEQALSWIEENLGRRYRSRASYTITPLRTLEDAQETSHYIDALGDDFLASMVWTVAAVCALHGGGDAGWARGLHDAR